MKSMSVECKVNGSKSRDAQLVPEEINKHSVEHPRVADRNIAEHENWYDNLVPFNVITEYWDSFSEVICEMMKEGGLAEIFVRFSKFSVDNVFKTLLNHSTPVLKKVRFQSLPKELQVPLFKRKINLIW